jgi:hypothetical protein
VLRQPDPLQPDDQHELQAAAADYVVGRGAPGRAEVGAVDFVTGAGQAAPHGKEHRG